MTTQVTLKATGAKGAGKSMLLAAIEDMFKGYGIRVVAVGGENERTFALPANAEQHIASIDKARLDGFKMLEQDRDRARELQKAADARAIQHIKERDETRAQFAELKKQLLRSELRIARLGGYIAHVQEREDAEQPAATRSENFPVSVPPLIRRVLGEIDHGDRESAARAMPPAAEVYRADHWTNYGNH